MDKIKVLIVEDESIVALNIKQFLLQLGYEVVGVAKDYETVMRFVVSHAPKFILMNIYLKNSQKNGIEIAQEIQKYKNNIFIIYLTASIDEGLLNRAIKTNPVSCLIKPCRLEDIKSTLLLAISQADRLNQSQKGKKLVKLGFGFYYNRADEILYCDSSYIKLSKNEKELLNILVDAKGAIVSYDDIEYLIWPQAPVSKSSLRTLVYRLRVKLDYKLIETVHSFGCRLIPAD